MQHTMYWIVKILFFFSHVKILKRNNSEGKVGTVK